MIKEREQDGLVDTALHPYLFTCDKEGCYYSVSARGQDSARIAAFKHGTAKNICPRVGAYYVKGVRIR
jgi:hypothetical protein